MKITLIFLIFIYFVINSIKQIESFKILISAPNYFHSHMNLHIKIADLLSEKGHEVTLLIINLNPYNEYPPENNTNWTKSQNIIKQSAKGKELKILKDSFNRSPFYNSNMWKEELEIYSKQNKIYVDNLFYIACKAFYSDKKLLSFLKSQNFDVGISEWHDSCVLSIFNYLNIKSTILTSPIPLDIFQSNIFGIPMPLYIPEVNTASLEGTKMNIFDRARTLYNRIENKAEYFFNFDDWCKDIFGINFIPRKELLLKSAFILINTNEMLDMAKPISSKIKHIGGFTLQNNNNNNNKQQLDAQTELILSKSIKGSILVSFGSVADPSLMPKEMFNNLMNSFSYFKEYNFILKTNNKENKIFNNKNESINSNNYLLPENVFKFVWVKQKNILEHPKIRLFISHCGLNSLNEAIFEGIPLLCIPLFGDQYYNSAIVNQRKIGKVLFKNQINENNLKKILNELLEEENNEYSKNAKIISQKMKMSPFQPKDILIKYIEFAAQFGGNFSELNLEGATMNNFAYFGLDILFSLIIFGILIFIILLKIFKILINVINFKKNKIE